MKRYDVKIVSRASEIDLAVPLMIDTFCEGTPGYAPRTWARIVYVRGSGLLCRMESEETDLRAEVTEPDGPTHKDSCLEFFVNCAPDTGDHYLNLEANPIGTLHCKFGESRHDRRALPQLGCALSPQVTVLPRSDGWALEYLLSDELISTLFGKNSLSAGDVLRANLYKCGDCTCHPHFGMWNPVKTEHPDFHRPEFFGELVVVE